MSPYHFTFCFHKYNKTLATSVTDFKMQKLCNNYCEAELYLRRLNQIKIKSRSTEKAKSFLKMLERQNEGTIERLISEKFPFTRN